MKSFRPILALNSETGKNKQSVALQTNTFCAKKCPKQGQSTHNRLVVGSSPTGPTIRL